jgi:hypothetical protein
MELAQLTDKANNAIAQQGLAAGEPDLGDTHAHQHAGHSQIIRKRQITVERTFISSAAIYTLVVAAVGDGNPQVSNRAAEFVMKLHSALGIQQSAGSEQLNAEC